jgi:uncharacterized protein (TIGR00106 family)
MIAAFSITPIGVGESVSELVAECVGIVRASGLPNETNAMFTNIEGEWDEVMRVIKQCVDHVAMTAPRVSVVVKIDYRRGVTGALRSKVETVEQRLRGGEQRTGRSTEAATSKADHFSGGGRRDIDRPVGRGARLPPSG